MFTICVKNFSSVVTDEDVLNALPAFQLQVDRDFAPAWGVRGALYFAPQDLVPAAAEWVLSIFDDADQAMALGYHDVTNAGTPLGKVFAKTTLDSGGSWTVTFSHELLEMLADPWINLLAFDGTGGRIYAYEVCDAVEADDLGYVIGNTRVSDFVLPSFFEPFAETSAPRSFCGHVAKAFELAPGGYLAFIDTSKFSAGWQQEFARRPGTSRHARRVKAICDRERSTTP